MLLKTIENCYPEMPDDAENLPRIVIPIPFEPKMNKKQSHKLSTFLPKICFYAN